jgi:hypothetical protein
MRGVLFSLAFAFMLAFAVPVRSGATAVSHDSAMSGPSSPTIYALQIPDKKIEITVGERSGGGRWYRSPVWIAIGALAAVIVLLLIVLIARGSGGTTIVKD